MTTTIKRIIRGICAGIMVAGISTVSGGSGAAQEAPAPLASEQDCWRTCHDCKDACRDKGPGKRDDCEKACEVMAAGCCTGIGKQAPNGHDCACSS